MTTPFEDFEAFRDWRQSFLCDNCTAYCISASVEGELFKISLLSSTSAQNVLN